MQKGELESNHNSFKCLYDFITNKTFNKHTICSAHHHNEYLSATHCAPVRYALKFLWDVIVPDIVPV